MGSEIFDGVHYYVLENKIKDLVKVSARLIQCLGYFFFPFLKVKQLMKEGGGSREFYMSDLVTHVISDVQVEPGTLPATEQQEFVTVHVSFGRWEVQFFFFD